MLRGAAGVVVAVSGGPDSVALLDMLAMLTIDDGVRGSGQTASRCRLYIAHLDHMLRGHQSEGDAQFVRALADKMGLEIMIGAVDIRAAAETAGRGIEETAREKRYDFLLSVANQTGCDRVAVGHTMSDQAETFVMRLIRGAGLRGLAAMRPVCPAHTFADKEQRSRGAEEQRGGGAEGQRSGGAEEQRGGGAEEQRGGGAEEQRGGGAEEQRGGGAEEQRGGGAEEQRGGGAEGQRSGGADGRRESAASPLVRSSAPLPLGSSAAVSSSPLLIRPLLCITREEVEEYCRQRKLEFRTDATNRDSRYTRNRIRSEIIPAMTAINPRAVSSIARAAENLATDQDALDSLLSSLMADARIERSRDRWQGKRSVAYSVNALQKQSPGMRRRMIIEAIRLARDLRDADPAAGEISAAHIRAVEGLLTPLTSGKHVVLPGGLGAWREFDALVFKQSETEPAGYRIAISAVDIDVQVAGFDFAIQRGLPGALFKSVVESTRHEKERTGFDWTAVALMDCTLPDCLIIRPRQSGERAHVLGQRRTIKLKNLMIDHRIPSSRRVDWPLVTTPDGRYVWSPGLPPAIEFAARDESQRLATMRASAI